MTKIDEEQIREKVNSYRKAWENSTAPLEETIQGLVSQGADEQIIRRALDLPMWRAVFKGGNRFGFQFHDLPGFSEAVIACNRQRKRYNSFLNSQLSCIPEHLSPDTRKEIETEIRNNISRALKAFLVAWLMPYLKIAKWKDFYSEEMLIKYYLDETTPLSHIEFFLQKHEAKEGQKYLFVECIFTLVEELKRIGKSETESYQIVDDIIYLTFDCQLGSDAIRLQYKREIKNNSKNISSHIPTPYLMSGRNRKLP